MRENIKENIMIFFLLFSLKNNEENKRKRREKWGKMLSGSVPSSRTSPSSPHFLGLLLHPGLQLRLDCSSSATLAIRQAISFAAAWIWSIQGEVGPAGG